MTTEKTLSELLFDRVTAPCVPEGVARLVLAAYTSEAALRAAANGASDEWTLDQPQPSNRTEHLYLSSIAVAGFRGVGPKATLPLDARSGLTLIVGRNGCGKSSFAEALELALTGDSIRWAERNGAVWREGWRNLHTPDPCSIEISLRADGQADPIRVARRWPDPRAGLDQAVCTVDRGRRIAATPAELGWDTPLGTYRPFLTAADFGRLLTSRPSELHDALRAILGLDPLTETGKRLAALAKEYMEREKSLRDDRTRLCAELATSGDERCQQAAAVLAGRKLDAAVLDAVDAVLALPTDDVPGGDGDACRRLLQVQLPDAAAVGRLAEELRQAGAAAVDQATVIAEASDRVARLLQLALAHHAETGDATCPVCETGTLGPEWRAAATERAAAAREQAASARAATDRLADARAAARRLLTSIPIREVPALDLTRLQAAQAAWAAVPDDAGLLADHLGTTFPPLLAALEEAQGDAVEWLRQRHDTWRQTAARLQAWLDAARVVFAEQSVTRELKQAQVWLRDDLTDLCNARLAPFALKSQEIWARLRQQSNVALDAIRLAGSGTVTQRRVQFDVSVDGAEGAAALAVMSQGELQALAMAVFLPRACGEESPFRFVVIDDPVQSMDPSKVDGLAQVLDELAADRQVVVFTHDNRLPEAVRRLDIDATIWEVHRRNGSVVTVEPSTDPVARHLDDAWAMARTDDLTEQVRGPVVAGLCRSAVEARCQDLVRRRRIGRGQPHADVERLLDGHGPMRLLALALFDDPDRGSEVFARLNRQLGPWAADVVRSVKEGTHGRYRGDLTRMISDTRRLLKEVAT
ncbi:AAA family ATPase [Dactylosporangium darangshiense]|uniref:Nuclease SbcCD subunit C n=1 Tax=Dactylosporangium darangshiense TaxID=579108 RepID=A0ABP8CTP9_9ACTN